MNNLWNNYMHKHRHRHCHATQTPQSLILLTNGHGQTVQNKGHVAMIEIEHDPLENKLW